MSHPGPPIQLMVKIQLRCWKLGQSTCCHSFFCVIVKSFWETENLYRLFIVWLYLYCSWRLDYQWGWVRTPLTGLTPPYVWACPKPGPGCPMPYVIVFTVFNGLRWEVVVHFVDIGAWNCWPSLFILSFHKYLYYLVSVLCFILIQFIQYTCNATVYA